MKTIVAILILLAFLEAAFLPIKLVLTVLLVRAFIRQDLSNLILAFGLGLLLSHLQNQPLGLNALIFLILVEAVYFWSKTTFSHNLWTAVPVIGALLLSVNTFSIGAYPSFVTNVLWFLVGLYGMFHAVRHFRKIGNNAKNRNKR